MRKLRRDYEKNNDQNEKNVDERCDVHFHFQFTGGPDRQRRIPPTSDWNPHGGGKFPEPNRASKAWKTTRSVPMDDAKRLRLARRFKPGSCLLDGRRRSAPRRRPRKTPGRSGRLEQ